MKKRKYLPADAFGKPLKVGNWVRVCGVPDLSGMTMECQNESRQVFRFAVRRNFIITEFDEVGCARLEVSIPLGENRGLHTIWVEPFLLNKRNRSG